MSMKIAIMQPYFLPYIGYFQLINAVDIFVVYDNIKYTKKGWINRNRLLQNGIDAMFSLPLKSDSDSLNVCQRELSSDFNPDKLLNQFRGNYSKAPYYQETISLVEKIFRYEERNLFQYTLHSIQAICSHLDIKTELKISSHIPIDHSLKAQDKVLALSKACGASMYINPIGGTELYSASVFASHDINLKFLKSNYFEYLQFSGIFIPWLSIVDILMFIPIIRVKDQICQGYELI